MNAALTISFLPGVTVSCYIGAESWRNQRWAQDSSPVTQVITQGSSGTRVLLKMASSRETELQGLHQIKLSGSLDFCRPCLKVYVYPHPKPVGLVNHIQLWQESGM